MEQMRNEYCERVGERSSHTDKHTDVLILGLDLEAQVFGLGLAARGLGLGLAIQGLGLGPAVSVLGLYLVTQALALALQCLTLALALYPCGLVNITGSWYRTSSALVFFVSSAKWQIYDILFYHLLFSPAFLFPHEKTQNPFVSSQLLPELYVIGAI